MIQHTFRNQFAGTARTITLDYDQLLIESRGERVRAVSLMEIRSIQLQTVGTGRVPHFRCLIETEQESIVLSSLDFIAIFRVANREESYHRFVTALHDRLANHAGRIRFTHCQMSRAKIVAMGCFLSLAILCGFAWSSGNFGTLVLQSGISVPLLACGLSRLQTSRGREYHPTSIPDGAIPEAAKKASNR